MRRYEAVAYLAGLRRRGGADRAGRDHRGDPAGQQGPGRHRRGSRQDRRTLHERTLAIYQARLGPDHPTTVRSRENLAAVVTELENRE